MRPRVHRNGSTVPLRAPEDVRKANLRGAIVERTDFYLVDVRGAVLDPAQRGWLKRCRAILDRE